MIQIKTKKKEIKFHTSKFIVNENINYSKVKKIINFDISVTLIKNIDKKVIVIISSDIVWFSDKLTNEIEKELSSKFNIDCNNIILSATHTHGSLQTDIEFKFGEFDENFNKVILENIIVLVKQLSVLDYIESNISLGVEQVNEISVNRRLYTYTFKYNEPFKRSQNRPNLIKKLQNNLYSLTFKSNEDKVLLVIIIYSCHPVTDKEHISGKDYPGILKKNIDKYFGTNNSIFLQGFCGDINPNFLKKQISLKELLINYIIGPSFRKPNENEKKEFCKILTKSSIKSINENVKLNDVEFKLSTIENKINDVEMRSIKRQLKIKKLSINQKYSLLFMNAEVLNDYDIYSKDSASSVGYTNGMIGYIAPKREYKYGGYEINGFLKRFNLKKKIHPEVDSIIKSNRLLLNSYKINKTIFKDKVNKYSYKGYSIEYIANNVNRLEINKLIDYYETENKFESFKNELNLFLGSFAVIIQKKNKLIAFTDSIRSVPIFYNEKKSKVSFDIFDIIFENNQINFDSESLLELNMCGYCLGKKTIFKNIFQIKAGEILTLRQDDNLIYYQFLPNLPFIMNDENQLLQTLENISNQIFKRLINKYKDKKILVPLSGGLDSRFVLSKLVELKCKNIEAFTYGEYNNGEYQIAKKIAKKLNVKLTFIGTVSDDTKRYFNSKKRLDYFSYSSSFSSTPNMQEYFVFCKIFEENIFRAEDIVIVNGQAGDFITGGHIPNNININSDENEMFDKIILKHFNLWKNLSTDKNRKYISEQLKKDFEKTNINLDEYPLQYTYLYWEWIERQSKFVSNQQRVYDFFNIEWYLPLWDREYLDFWKNLDLKYLNNQYLYKLYLNKWNYKNVFDNDYNRGNVNPWIGINKIVIFIANIFGFLLGPDKKSLIYNYLKYFNHYSYHYGAYKYSYFFKRAKNIRNHLSLYVETFIKDFAYSWYDKNNKKK